MANIPEPYEVSVASQPPGQKCNNCKFFFAVAAPPGYVGACGECRANVPDAQIIGMWGRWPMVKSDQWCGQWVAGA